MQLCDFEVGLDRPFFLIAGPCVIEDERLILETAATLKALTDALSIPFIFKSSFDKANRSSHQSFRGPGIDEGLRILARVREEIGVPVLTDVHEDTPLDAVSAVVDVLQTPAFLCRQTDFILRVCSQGKPVNIKKGQFLAPLDMLNVAAKARPAPFATCCWWRAGTTPPCSRKWGCTIIRAHRHELDHAAAPHPGPVDDLPALVSVCHFGFGQLVAGAQRARADPARH